jgi:hypothetical protein
VAAAGSVLAATAGSALGVVLYLALAALVLRLSIRWAREALGETASATVAGPERSGPKSPARG